MAFSMFFGDEILFNLSNRKSNAKTKRLRKHKLRKIFQF